MDRRSCSKDLLPFVVLVANECSNTGLFTLFKAATLQGMSNFVFVTYAYALATIVLLPVSFFYRRSRVVPPLSFSILSKIALLGVIGCSSQILGYVGISYSSPTLSSAISNLIPAFTFMLAIICRYIFVVAMYANIQQAIVAATVGLFAERNTSAWKIRPDISLISIVCTGIFNKFLSSLIYAWAIHLKGPVYVAMFKPISIVIAVAMGVMFLGDNLHVGSIIGATIISIGFYTVMWGKATEEKEEENVGNQESPTAENVPLLRSYKTVNSEKKIHGSV
ncbi:WAT1-related protein At4g15540-like isoform X2 [Gastrolobium bilobum]|uniref:WAT1-related protein At4g15540-like isoform X2 n=1 Tax=Gastrolobium bilobum TaxID=150636 RepID=UPI002AB08B5A|nr:WAT1-related protein At4g15540-like isoform X2 [Gastrolobium bilobum]